MGEREKLWQMLKRTHAIGDRVTADICQRIEKRESLTRLDDLFALSKRAHALYRRIYARYSEVLAKFESI
jgi:hypothetical protein